MYQMEVMTKRPFSEKQKNVLYQSVQDAAPDAVCRLDHTTCEIVGTQADLEKISYLLGIVLGSCLASEILKLQLSYEKSEEQDRK